MAFWGVEVKPGKPFIHSPKNGQRLHLSQATLGLGSSTKKSTVQCNIGNSSPVFLCSLFPDKNEVSQLNLEYEESVDVTFSVIGPQSVHLTGYYCLHSSGQHYHRDDESESYGQDLGDTDTERSADGSDEDDYEDSFINDDDDNIEVIPHSPVSGCRDEEMFGMKKANNGKGNRRRLKKRQVVESDDEDKLPISLLREREFNGKGSGSETKEKDAKVKGKTCKETKDDGSLVSVSKGKSDAVVDLKCIDHRHSIQPSSEQNVVESDNKGEKRHKEEKQLESAAEDDFFFGMVLGQDKSKQSEIEAQTLRQALPMSEEVGQKTANHKNAEKAKKRREKGAKVAKSQETKDDGSLVTVSKGESDGVVDVKSKMQMDHDDSVQPSSEAGLQKGAESDKKEEEHPKEEKQHKIGDEDVFSFAMSSGEDRSKQSEIEVETLGRALPMREKEGQKIANDKNAGKAKKKREKGARVAKSQQMAEHEDLQAEAEAKNARHHVLVTDNENQKLTNDKIVNENLQAEAEAKNAGHYVLVTDNETQKLTNDKIVNENLQTEAEAKNAGQHVLVTDSENQKLTNDKIVNENLQTEAEAKNAGQHVLVTDSENQKLTNDKIVDENLQTEAEADNAGQHVLVTDNENQKLTNDKGDNFPHLKLALADLVPENVAKPKKKKRNRAKEEKSFESEDPLTCSDDIREDQPKVDVVPEYVEKPKKKKRKQSKEEKSYEVDGPLDCSAIAIEDRAQQDQAKAEIFEHPLPTNEVDPKQANYETFDLDQSVDDKKKQKKKRKKNEENKKSRNRENGEDLDVESKIGNQDGIIAAPGEKLQK